MKFVYVLTCDSVVDYAVQCYMSVWSLRYHNPGATVVLVTDEKTKSYLEKNYNILLDTVDTVKVVDVPESLSSKSRSRFIKTSLRQNIEGDFLYLDSDTVVAGGLDRLTHEPAHIAAVFDCNADGYPSRYMIEKLQSIGVDKFDDYVCYNGGIIKVKDTPEAHDFFYDWHETWLDLREKYGMEIDQAAFLIANRKNGNVIKELSGIYNCQLPFPSSVRYFIDAKIIHYISDWDTDSSYPLKDTVLLHQIQKNGLDDKTKEILVDPKTSFLSYNLILHKNDRELYESPVSVLARKISRDFPWTNKIVCMIYRIFGYEI